MTKNNRQRDFITASQSGPLFENTGGVMSLLGSAASTYDLVAIKGRMLMRDPEGGTPSDVTPTAAAILALDPAAQVGDSFEFTIRNIADGAETITLTGGVGVTIDGTATIEQSNQKTFLVVKTSETTVTLYSMGTVVF